MWNYQWKKIQDNTLNYYTHFLSLTEPIFQWKLNKCRKTLEPVYNITEIDRTPLYILFLSKKLFVAYCVFFYCSFYIGDFVLKDFSTAPLFKYFISYCYIEYLRFLNLSISYNFSFFFVAQDFLSNHPLVIILVGAVIVLIIALAVAIFFIRTKISNDEESKGIHL